VSETVADSELTRVDRSGRDTAVDMTARTSETEETRTAQAPAPAPQAAPRTGTPVTPEPPPAPQPRQTDRAADTAARDAERTDLPDTAGLLPLLALIGVGSVIGSRMLRRSRMRA
jgi:hypothetical protein